MTTRKIKSGKVIKMDDVNGNFRTKVEYRPDLESLLNESLFSVDGPYKIITNDEGEKVIVSLNHDKKILHDIPDTMEIYNPFEVTELFTEANKVDTDSKESILNFCNQYGLFNGDEENNFDYESPLEYMGAGMGYQRITTLPLNKFIDEIEEIKAKLRIIAAIQNNDKFILERCKIELIHVNKTIWEEHMSKEDLDTFIKRMEANPAAEVVKANLIKSLDKHLKHVHPTIKIGPNGSLVPGYKTDSLLGVIYLQIREMIYKTDSGGRMEQCLKCGDYFVVTRKGQKFCSPKGPEKVSSCQNSYNQMRYKAKRAILSGEKTIEEVCSQTKRTYEEVRSWIE